MSAGERIENVVGCARCGGDHEGLAFRLFARPVNFRGLVTFSRWATCPTTGDPILLRIIPAEEET